MIKVEGLTKRYARHVAVNNISFEVEKGEIVGFLGKNGAGKTTTMRVLTCFLPPTAGKATVAGFDVLDQSLDVRKHIGYLPETPPLYPEMEVSTYLTFVAKLKGIPSADVPKRVSEVCDRTGIASVKDTIIGKLSKGYRQRVGIAQAIIHNPPVLILDEPTSGLDPQQQREARQLIASLGGDHTIILSTHILSEVEQSCSKVIIINNGEIVVSDSVVNLHNRRRASESVLRRSCGRRSGCHQAASGTGGGRGARRVPRQPQWLRSFRSPRSRELLGAAGTGPRGRAIRLESDGTAACRRIARGNLPRTDKIRGDSPRGRGQSD